MKTYDEQSKLFKALMHPARLAILDELREGEQCVCHLEAALGYRQAYISQQLMILRESGLVQDIRDGWNIFYRVVQPQVYEIIDATASLLEQDSTIIRRPRQATKPQLPCPCPKCNPGAEKVRQPDLPAHPSRQA